MAQIDISRFNVDRHGGFQSLAGRAGIQTKSQDRRSKVSDQFSLSAQAKCNFKSFIAIEELKSFYVQNCSMAHRCFNEVR